MLKSIFMAAIGTSCLAISACADANDNATATEAEDGTSVDSDYDSSGDVTAQPADLPSADNGDSNGTQLSVGPDGARLDVEGDDTDVRVDTDNPSVSIETDN